MLIWCTPISSSSANPYFSPSRARSRGAMKIGHSARLISYVVEAGSPQSSQRKELLRPETKACVDVELA
jgi:hypothetical protein